MLCPAPASTPSPAKEGGREMEWGRQIRGQIWWGQSVLHSESRHTGLYSKTLSQKTKSGVRKGWLHTVNPSTQGEEVGGPL